MPEDEQPRLLQLPPCPGNAPGADVELLPKFPHRRYVVALRQASHDEEEQETGLGDRTGLIDGDGVTVTPGGKGVIPPPPPGLGLTPGCEGEGCGTLCASVSFSAIGSMVRTGSVAPRVKAPWMSAATAIAIPAKLAKTSGSPRIRLLRHSGGPGAPMRYTAERSTRVWLISTIRATS